VGISWKNYHVITFSGESLSKNRKDIEGRMEVTGRRGRRLKKLLGDLRKGKGTGN
jgi:hypothetical protein